MAEELVPRPEIRVSDAERNQAVDQLNRAVGEGRLTLGEFEDRVQGVLAARTRDDIAAFMADLPVVAGQDVLTLRSRSSSLRRIGRWTVPRQVVVETRSSNVKLDLTAADLTSTVIEVALAVRSSSVTLVLPPGASAVAHEVEPTSSTLKVKVPDAGGLHVVVRGQMRSSTLRVRYQRRFLHWRW